MAISDIKTAMASAINTALSIKCYTSAPSVIAELPCAYILPRRGDYKVTLPMSNIIIEFEVVLFVGKMADLGDAQATLDGYLLPTGTGSMKAAIEATALSTNASFLRVEGFSDYGGMTYSGTEYLGARWQVTIVI